MSLSRLKRSRRVAGQLFLGLLLGGVAIYFLPNQLLAVYSERSEERSNQSTDDSPAERRHPRSKKFDYVPGEVLVKFRKNISSRDIASIQTQSDAEELGAIQSIRIRRVRGRRGQSTEELIAMYSKRPEVEYVEPNGIVHTMLTPDDSLFLELWGLNNTGQSGGTADADIDAPEAWDVQTGSSNVIVADIDSGVDYNHPDLAANIWTNPGEIPGNGIDDDGNGFIDDVRGWNFVNNTNNPFDDRGHGTHTAGTIAAAGNNGTGVVGVSWRAKIMPVKHLNSSGDGTFENAANAILYASQMGAKISNNSWGCDPDPGCFSQVIQDALEIAYQRGMLFVVSAGNSNNDNDIIPTYPCNNAVPNVLCVTATDRNDQKAGFSNYGATTVHLGAPGVSILSTVPTGSCLLCSPSGYRVLSGTSMAVPHVAGAAAVVLSRFPGLTVEELKSILIGSVDPIPSMTGITQTGGRLNVNNALPRSFILSAIPDSQSILIGQMAEYTITLQSLDNSSTQITLDLTSPDPNITGSFSPSIVTLPANGSVQATLDITTNAAAARGEYVLTIRATNTLGEIHSTTVTLNLTGPDFTISVNPASRTTEPGSMATYAVSVNSFEGYSAPVTLSMTSSDTNISGSFSPNPVLPPVNSTVTALLTVTTTLSIPQTDHVLTIQATDGVKTRNKSATLKITDTDLIMLEINAPSIAIPGTPIAISDSVKNNGTQTVSGFYTDFYLLPNAAITSPYGGKGNAVLYPRIAMDTSGNAIAIWEEPAGSSRNIFANRYAASINRWGTPKSIQLNFENSADDPDVRINDNGNAIAAWVESDHVWANQYPASTDSWGIANQIDTSSGVGNTGDNPLSLAINNNGNAVVLWKQQTGGLFSYQIWANYYTAGTNSWGTPTQIQTNVGGSDSGPSVAIDDNGNALAVWEESDGIRANRYDASNHSWETDLLIKPGTDGNSYPQITMDSNGNAMVVVGSSVIGSSAVGLWAIRYIVQSNSWDPPAMISNTLSIKPRVAMDESGNAVVVWENESNVWANRYVTGFNSWGIPAQIENNAGNAVMPQVAVDASGNAVVVWQGSNENLPIEGSYNIWSNRYNVSTNSWGTPTLIETTSSHAWNPQIGIDAAGNAISIWSQENDGQVYNVWANRYVAGTNSWGTAVFIEPYFLGSRIVDELASGGTNSGNTTVTIPNVPEGTFYIGAVPDNTNLVEEGNEMNNGLVSNNPIILSATATTTTSTTTTTTTTITTTTSSTTTTTMPNPPPGLDSLTPVNISTLPSVVQSFTAVYSDPNGWQNLSNVSLSLSGSTHNELLHYNPQTNRFTLVGASGDCSPGNGATLTNGFLTLNCNTSSASGSGTNLTVIYNLTPQPPLSGAAYRLVLAAADQGGANVNKDMGYWVVNRQPSACSAVPMNSTTPVGVQQTFVCAYSDPDGYQNIAEANFYLASGGLHNEWLHYLPAPNLFIIMGSNDSCSPGQATMLSNGYLTLDCGASSISGSGTTLTVTFRVTPLGPSSGLNYNIFTGASDHAGAAHGAFGGTWQIP